MIASGSDRDGFRAEMSGTSDVVRRVAQDYELRGLEFVVESLADVSRRDCGQIFAAVRFFAERAQ